MAKLARFLSGRISRTRCFTGSTRIHWYFSEAALPLKSSIETVPPNFARPDVMETRILPTVADDTFVCSETVLILTVERSAEAIKAVSVEVR